MIYCSIEDARANWNLPSTAGWNYHVPWEDEIVSLRQATQHMLRAEVTTYDQYLTDDVYGYRVEVQNEDGEWTEIDSCWGFFGLDLESNGMADQLDSLWLIELAKQAATERLHAI